MLSSIALFLATKLGRYVFAGGVGVALLVGFTMQQRRIGAEKAIAKIEAKTNEDVQKADGAGRKSAAGHGVQLNFRD
jgi:uncharacterized membrane protein YczE